MEAERTDLRR
jgi:hypothetical protein